ncbi:MAG: hypothetical protein M3Q29_01045 [Chloroflexota bacterium]|nr:hypothetical protein [Chloroflexota bacterium]
MQEDSTQPSVSPTDEVTAEDRLTQGLTSATGRVDVPDASMGSGSGSGMFSRGEDSEGMRDAPADSNLQGSPGPSGDTGYPTQEGGTPEG